MLVLFLHENRRTPAARVGPVFSARADREVSPPLQLTPATETLQDVAGVGRKQPPHTSERSQGNLWQRAGHLEYTDTKLLSY